MTLLELFHAHMLNTALNTFLKPELKIIDRNNEKKFLFVRTENSFSSQFHNVWDSIFRAVRQPSHLKKVSFRRGLEDLEIIRVFRLFLMLRQTN
jgi:hypothetical protein